MVNQPKDKTVHNMLHFLIKDIIIFVVKERVLLVGF